MSWYAKLKIDLINPNPEIQDVENIRVLREFKALGGAKILLVEISRTICIVKIFLTYSEYRKEIIAHSRVLQAIPGRAPQILATGFATWKTVDRYHRDMPLYVMEYFEGPTVTQLIQNECVSRTRSSNSQKAKKVKLARRLARELFHIIRDLQMNDLRHCDLHTNNVIQHRGQLKLIDFGHTKRACRFIRGKLEMVRNVVINRLRSKCGVPRMRSLFVPILKTRLSSFNTDLLSLTNLASLISEAFFGIAKPDLVQKMIEICNQFSPRRREMWPESFQQYYDLLIPLISPRSN